jgi:hypothetical protein
MRKILSRRPAVASLAFAVLFTLLTRDAAAGEQRNAVYLELLGKGGLWGLGYDFDLSRRWAVGAAASFYMLDGEQVLTLSPYAGVYPARGRHHSWFVQAGPQLVRLAIPSPVPEWKGTSSIDVGAELSTGWEYRNHILVRGFVMASAGKNGVLPWLGLSLGWAL